MAKAVGVESFDQGQSGVRANSEYQGQRHQDARRLDELGNTLLSTEAGSSARAQVNGKFALAAAGAAGATHSVEYDNRKIEAMRTVALGNEESTQVQTQSASAGESAVSELNRSLV